MKKTKSISNVLGICPIQDFLAVFTQEEIIEPPQNIFEIRIDNLQSFSSSNQEVIYQSKESSEVTLLTKDLETITYEGDFSILKAFEYKSGFIIVNRDSKSYHYINSSINKTKDLEFFFKKSGNINANYLYKRLGEEIKIFSLSKKKEISKINVSDYFDNDVKAEGGVFGMDETIYIPLSIGQILALNISSGKLKWKQEQVGKTSLFNDKIYCVVAHSLKDIEIKVLDTESGEVIHSKMMPNLDQIYGFRPTGKHKVYDKYIFIMASRKPGLVAVVDRETLEFQEMIVLEESIPNDLEHLHWHKDRLYILDAGRTLHVYEEEDVKEDQA